MICIGLTGGIASGKSTVSTMLHDLGAFIIDADKLARQVVEPDQPAWQEIVTVFGAEVLLPDRQLNRQALGNIIFTDSQRRQLLETITHPRIRQAAEAQLEEAARNGRQVAVLDVPLLIETGWIDMVDTVWVVYVSPVIQEQRLMERDRLGRQQAQARIASQMSLQDKLQYANVIIDNGHSLAETQAQVISAWQKLLDSNQEKA